MAIFYKWLSIFDALVRQAHNPRRGVDYFKTSDPPKLQYPKRRLYNDPDITEEEDNVDRLNDLEYL